MTALDWTCPVRDVPAGGLEFERAATPEECRRLAASLDILEVVKLNLLARIAPAAGGHVELKGRIEADVVQACVATLDPLPAALTLPVWALLCPPGTEPGEADGRDPDDIDGPEIEPLENGIVDLGRIVYEELASGLDPYPRAAGATLEWQDAPEALAVDHPFAALARLRKPDQPS